MFEIQVDDAKFHKNLEHVIDQLLPEAVRQGLQKACLIVERDAKKKCPVDDGTLRASITHEVKDEEGIVGTDVEYAPYTHEGTGIYAAGGHGRQTPWRYRSADGTWHTTSGQKPKPFLKEAFEENKDEILKSFADLLKG